jgi:aspartyl protease family protein
MRKAIGFVLIVGSLAFLASRAGSWLDGGSDQLAALAEKSPAPIARAPQGTRKVAIPADASTHYFADAVVNGHTISVIVDTGATAVALTEESARRLGIRPAQSEFTARISTANGVVGAAPIVISEIRLGAITVRNVPAIVVPGNALGVNLLGMSFLSRLHKFEVGGGQLVLTQ